MRFWQPLRHRWPCRHYARWSGLFRRPLELLTTPRNREAIPSPGMGVTLKTVHLESWLVETMFGDAKEHFPHVKCEMHAMSHKLVGPWRCTWDLDVLVTLLPTWCIWGNNLGWSVPQTPGTKFKESCSGSWNPVFSSPASAPEVSTQQSPIGIYEAATQWYAEYF